MACVRILLFSPGLQVWWHCDHSPHWLHLQSIAVVKKNHNVLVFIRLEKCGRSILNVLTAWVSVAGSGFSFVPKAVCAVVDCFSFHFPGPLLGSNSTGGAAGWPLSPDRPDTGAGVLIKPVCNIPIPIWRTLFAHLLFALTFSSHRQPHLPPASV